jgi:hypothetical protein
MVRNSRLVLLLPLELPPVTRPPVATASTAATASATTAATTPSSRAIVAAVVAAVGALLLLLLPHKALISTRSQAVDRLHGQTGRLLSKVRSRPGRRMRGLLNMDRLVVLVLIAM